MIARSTESEGDKKVENGESRTTPRDRYCLTLLFHAYADLHLSK